uniref:MPN domain-containing protein n=1 Tax=Steinernema glaseri TaxID=37863 RepID=A0A1I7Y3R5_9BILA
MKLTFCDSFAPSVFTILRVLLLLSGYVTSIEMASTITVKVHPVVYLTIVDAYERRSQKVGANDRALGTLMGFYEKNAVQVTNCYAIPFNEANKDSLEIDESFNFSMMQDLRKATPNEQIVGWFYTNADLPEHAVTFHDYYQQMICENSGKRDPPPVILLTIDTTFAEDNARMPVRAYVRTNAGVPATANSAEKRHCTMFCPLKVELDAFPGESVAMSIIQNGTDSKLREVKLDDGLDQLEMSTKQIIQWL